MPTPVRARACLVSLTIALGSSAAQAQQPPPIGVAPVVLNAGPYTFDTAEQHGLRVVVVARGLNHPFAIAPLPNGDALVTERGRALRLVRGIGGATPAVDPTPVAGLPAPPTIRGGGWQEVVLHPKFVENRLVYLSYNAVGSGADATKSAVAIGRGRFTGTAIEGFTEIFRGDYRDGNSGSRLAFGPDGFLYVTTGAPNGDYGQQLSSVYGKVLRLRDDGTVPPDNPFVGRPGARGEVFAFGFRDQLGLAVHASGAVFAADNGPNGGDEVNIVSARGDYGWPTSTFGRNYDGTRMAGAAGSGTEELPAILWVPSIAPTGLAFYTGDRFPSWKGNLLVGSARRGEVPRTGGLDRVVLNERLQEIRRETLLTELRQRIRDVRQGVDGLVYLVTDEDDGAVLRLEPAPSTTAAK